MNTEIKNIEKQLKIINKKLMKKQIKMSKLCMKYNVHKIREYIEHAYEKLTDEEKEDEERTRR